MTIVRRTAVLMVAAFAFSGLAAPAAPAANLTGASWNDDWATSKVKPSASARWLRDAL